MSDIQTYVYSEEDGQDIMNYARDTLEVYAKEGQKMDVGSVDDLLNMRGGVFLRLKSTGSFGRVRGDSGSFGNQRLASALINSTVYAASNRSVGSEIARNELSKVVFELAPIEKIKISEEPVEDINLGVDVPIIDAGKDGWIYPTDPQDYGWSVREYLGRTCKKCDLNPNYWEDKNVIIATTRPINEVEPDGELIFSNHSSNISR